MELKRLSDLFWNVLPNAYFLSVILGVLTGLCNALLVPFIMYSISSDVEDAVDKAGKGLSFFDSPTSNLAWVFLLTCVLIVMMRGLSTSLSIYVANRASLEHRVWLYRRIRNLKLADLERIGQARLVNILNIDIPAVTNAAICFPQIWISTITILGVLGYLVHVNVSVFGFVIVCIVLAVISYQLPLIVAQRFLKKSRDNYDLVQQGITGLIYGAKELRLNRIKSEAYLEFELHRPERAALSASLTGGSIFTFTQCYGDMLAFLIVGIVVYQFRYSFSLNASELFGLVMALLYLTGPVSGLLNLMGPIQRGRVSLGKLQAFYEQLQDESVKDNLPVVAGWERIRINNLCYSYGKVSDGFSVQNANMEFSRGEITFIIGGNGSGKSTLGKCLSFLYFPTSGHICIGEDVINQDNLDAARQMVSAIFADYYLFKKLYSESDSVTRTRIQKYLKYLELDHKVSVIDGVFTTTDLSEGQRKRLALLVMLIEDREICIFDEWAADQDPSFKKIFYSIILPDLKNRNKVVIVISHDDRYFDCADQIITMENGQVSATVRREQASSQKLISDH